MLKDPLLNENILVRIENRKQGFISPGDQQFNFYTLLTETGLATRCGLTG